MNCQDDEELVGIKELTSKFGLSKTLTYTRGGRPRKLVAGATPVLRLRGRIKERYSVRVIRFVSDESVRGSAEQGGRMGKTNVGHYTTYAAQMLT